MLQFRAANAKIIAAMQNTIDWLALVCMWVCIVAVCAYFKVYHHYAHSNEPQLQSYNPCKFLLIWMCMWCRKWAIVSKQRNKTHFLFHMRENYQEFFFSFLLNIVCLCLKKESYAFTSFNWHIEFYRIVSDFSYFFFFIEKRLASAVPQSWQLSLLLLMVVLLCMCVCFL